MKTLTVQEASQSLSEWLRRAADGEQIAINEGKWTVLLQPIPRLQEASARMELPAREALRRLQSQQRLTAAQAENYLREVRAERLTEVRRGRQ